METSEAAALQRARRMAILGPLLLAFFTFLRVHDFTFTHAGDVHAVLWNPWLSGHRATTTQDFLRIPGYVAPSPVTAFSYKLDDVLRAAGPIHEAGGRFHLTHLLVHLGSVALLATLVLRLGGNAYAAGLAAGIFGMHPAAAESVGWIWARPHLLATLFSLLSIHLWVAQRRTAAAITALLAALSHPAAAALPLVFAAADGLKGQRLSARRWVGAGALTTAGSLLLLGVLGRAGDLPDRSFVERLARFPAVFGMRLAGLLWPPALGPLGGPPVGSAWIAAAALGGAALLIVLALLWIGSRRPRLAWFGLLMAAAALAPTLGLLPIERPFTSAHLTLPLAALALTAGAVLSEAGPRIQVAAAVAALMLGAGANGLVGSYESPGAMVAASKRFVPGSPEQITEQANAVRTMGNLSEAMRLLAEMEIAFPEFHGHLRMKGDIFRAAGRKREAYWAYVFAVRNGDTSACRTLISDTVGETWTPGNAEKPEIRACLRKVLSDLLGDASEETRSKAQALARTVDYVP